MYRKLFKIALSAGLLALTGFTASAQALERVQEAVHNHYKFNVQEKLFVHTDRSTYIAGDIIWFKVYAAEVVGVAPAVESKVVYVDVLSADNKPLLQTKIAMTNGAGSGSLTVPQAAANGNYKLRAYTNWMKNFSAETFFQKQINIFNPLLSPDATGKAAGEGYDIQFFPEGGNMVVGLPGKVAFRAVGKDGKGVQISGEIVDDNSITVANFSTLRHGIGQFTFTPQPNRRYTAVARTGESQAKIVPMPAAQPQGYALTVVSTLDVVKVTASTNSGAGGALLVIHNGKEVAVATQLTFANGVAIFEADKTKMTDGVSHITLFNMQQQPVAERLIFKRPSQSMSVAVQADAAAYGNRKKVDLNIGATDERGVMQRSNLSLSVYRVDSLQYLEQEDIVSYFWLGSELKGKIEAPASYLSRNDGPTNEALDNLMLTHGWRRFKWETAMQMKKPLFTYIPELYGHLVTGKLTGPENKPGAGVHTFMGVVGKRIQYYSSKGDSVGVFNFNTKDLYGQNELVIQTNYEADSIYKLQIYSPFSEQYSDVTLEPYKFTPPMLGSLRKGSLASQVNNVYAGSKLRQFYPASVDTTAFFGQYDKRYVLKDYTRFTTMEEVLREYVAEVNLVKRQRKFHFKVLTAQYGFLDNDPLVLVDGIPFFDMEKVIKIDPLKVNSLDIVRHRYFYGPAVTDGILVFNTIKGDLAGAAIEPHSIVIDYEGMQLKREFYAPDYSSAADLSNKTPDFRTVLFWSPDLATDLTGKGKTSFYTSDLPGKYIGVIQGVSATGVPGGGTFVFDVK